MIKVGNTRRFGSIGARSLMPGAAAPPIVCAYPLDASQAEIQAAGHFDKLTVSGDDQQTATLTIPQPASARSFAASFAGFTNPTTRVDMSTGDVAWEWEFLTPNTVEGNIYKVSAEISNYVDATVGAVLSLGGAGYTLTLSHYNGGTITMLNNSPITVIGAVMTLGIQLSGNTCRAWINGVEATLANNTNVLRKNNMFAVVSVSEPATGDVDNTGKVIGARLVSDADQYTTPFPGGSVDLCGNEV